MKIVGLTGAKGRIGKALISRGCISLDCDVTNPMEIQKEIKYRHPDLVVHLASKSGVDFCQKEENDKIVSSTNVRGAYNVFDAAGSIPVVFLSSDHIFDGKAWFPYKENAKPNPINQYGLSKYCAEQLAMTFDNVKIVRSSTVFSWEREMIQEYARMWANGWVTYAPTQLKRCFIFVRHFADALMSYIRKFDSAPKILNIAGSECVSWYEFTRSLAERLEMDKKLAQRRTYDNGGTPRAKNLGLNTTKASSMGIDLPSYEEGIIAMVEDYSN